MLAKAVFHWSELPPRAAKWPVVVALPSTRKFPATVDEALTKKPAEVEVGAKAVPPKTDCQAPLAPVEPVLSAAQAQEVPFHFKTSPKAQEPRAKVVEELK